jgi:hypothetical protein
MYSTLLRRASFLRTAWQRSEARNVEQASRTTQFDPPRGGPESSPSLWG